MQSGSGKKIDVARLKADVAAVGVEILSAQCAADRVRLRYSPEDVVTFGEHLKHWDLMWEKQQTV